MRYAIGARIVENDGKISDGIFAYNKYGLSCILVSDNLKKDEYRTPIFADINEANDFAKRMRLAYKEEFHQRASRYNLDLSQFRFFVIKVDSSKFGRTLGDIYKTTKETQYKTRKYYYIT